MANRSLELQFRTPAFGWVPYKVGIMGDIRRHGLLTGTLRILPGALAGFHS